MARFVDEARVFVRAGKGGDGAIAFLREKFRPFGGPAGGDGGKGGDVVFEADEGSLTLLDFKYRPVLIAKNGENGRGKGQHGRSGDDLVVKVPVGTVVLDEATGEVIAELLADGQRAVVAKGGRGGLGNKHFATPTCRAPRIATPGRPGEERYLRLELKLIADVGLVGLPNAGKSTLLAALTGAKPKIAPYPFTTLVPNLGRVITDLGQGYTVADIPGLIKGAHLGQGLGIRFLRHLARTRALVFVVDIASDVETALSTLKQELEAFDHSLLERPSIVALNKVDLVTSDVVADKIAQAKLMGLGDVYPISARYQKGLAALVEAVKAKVAGLLASSNVATGV